MMMRVMGGRVRKILQQNFDALLLTPGRPQSPETSVSPDPSGESAVDEHGGTGDVARWPGAEECRDGR